MNHNLNANGDLCEKNNIAAKEFRKDSATDRMVFSEGITVSKNEVKEECYDFDMPIDDIEFRYIKEEYVCSSEYNFRKENLGSMKSTEQSSSKNVEDVTVTKTEVKEECYDVYMTIDDRESRNIEQEYISLSENNFIKENLEPMKQFSNKNIDVGNGELREAALQTNKYRCELCQSDFDEEIYLRSHREHCPFARQKLSKEHARLNRNVDKTYSCAHCTFSSSIRSRLVNHVRIHTKDRLPKRSYKKCKCTPEQEASGRCDMCGFTATQRVETHRKNSLAQHKRIHMNKKLFKCTYKNCRCATGQKEFCKCDMCRYATARKYDLCRHVLVKHSGKPKKYKCRDCKYATHAKKALVLHSSIHTNEKPFRCTYKDCKCAPGKEEFCKCDTCGYTAAGKPQLKRHVLVKHSGEPKKYQCRECMYATHMKESLVVHSRIHTNQKPFRCTYKDCKCAPGQEELCKCDTCEFTTAGKYRLKRHVMVKHSGEPKKYRCRDCKYATHMKTYLVLHSRIHFIEKRFKCTYKDCRCAPGQEEFCKCDMCGYTAAAKYNLKRHVLVKHSGELKKYKCRDCNFATHTRMSLVLHSRIHAKEKPFRCTYKDCTCAPGQVGICKCDTCRYATIDKASLRKHVLIKHSAEPKQYKCRHCKYATHRKNSLVVHSRIHSNEKPFRCTYKDCICAPGQEEFCNCGMCGFKTAGKHTLKRHVLVKHSGEQKKYRCKDCKYATHMKKSLELHCRTHTKEKPFKCTYKDCGCALGQEELCNCDTCGFTASTKFSLKRHVLVKHSGEPKKYKCRDCKYTTHRKNSLILHSHIHSNEKPYRCTYKNCKCEPKQGESVCKCDTCEYATKQKCNIKRHVLAKHSGERENKN